MKDSELRMIETMLKKQDEMTICECVEYLDSMVGDDKNIKDCLDYIERKAKSMDKKLRDYKKSLKKNIHLMVIHLIS